MYKRSDYVNLRGELIRSIRLRRGRNPIPNIDRGWRLYDSVIKKYFSNTPVQSRFLNTIKCLMLYLPNTLDTRVNVKQKIVKNFDKRDFTSAWDHCNIMEQDNFFSHSGKTFRRGLFVYGDRLVRLRKLLFRYLSKTVERHYNFVQVPTMVSETMLYNTGQLPKFKDDFLFKIEGQDWFLSPTGEVQLGNLPVNRPGDYCTFTKCFRNEVTYGKLGKGLIRNLEFEKMELFSYTEPEKASLKIRKMKCLISMILGELGIPYRVLLLDAADMSWTARITYDFETWLPLSKHYLELSSVSDCGEYQTRRRGLKFKRNAGVYQPHTLNGSCLPVGRTLIALVEYHGLEGAITLLEGLNGR